MDASKRQEIALFRYQVIAPLVTQNLTRVQYGLLLHELTRQEFNHGDLGERQLGRRTIQRWVHSYRQKGLEGWEPAVRSDKSTPKVVAPAVLDQAIALRREVPGRSVDQIIAILEWSGKVEKGTLKRSTLNEHLVKAGCTRAAVVQAAKRRPSLRRWEAPNRNAVWQVWLLAATPHSARPAAATAEAGGLPQAGYPAIRDSATRLRGQRGDLLQPAPAADLRSPPHAPDPLSPLPPHGSR